MEPIEQYVLKTCNHCKGKGLVYIDERTAFSRLGMFNGYSYKNTAGNIKCKECNGAGKVKYIIQKVELLIKEGK